MKWLLVAVAVLLVIAISVGVTLFFTRDGSESNHGATLTAAPGAGDVASANDTGPVSIITSDPTCQSWRPLQNSLSATMSNGWQNRDPSVRGSDWTTEQRSQFYAVAEAMRAAADRAVELSRRTPHRVMRELYSQQAAYGRSYADAVAHYSPELDFLARTNVNLTDTLSTVCDAIESGSAAMASPHEILSSSPTQEIEPGDLENPRPFIQQRTTQCANWVSKSSKFEASMQEWNRISSSIPASAWTDEQRALEDAAMKSTASFAKDIREIGARSGDLTFDDISNLASSYLQAFSQLIPTYTEKVYFLINPAFTIKNAVRNACLAVA